MRLKSCLKCKKLYSPDDSWEIEDPCMCDHNESKGASAYVQADIEPYESMITHEMITSRSHHRSHMKQYGVIEAGNEQKYFMNTDRGSQVMENDSKRHEIERKFGPEISRQIDKLSRSH